MPAANDYYDSTGAPTTRGQGASATIRAEFDLVEAGFNKLPAVTGAADRIPHVNAGATAMTTTSGFTMSSGGFLTVPNGMTVTTGGAVVFGGVTVNTAALAATAGFTVTGGAVNIAPANVPVTISPTGTGSVVISPTGSGGLTINPSTAGTMNNVAIGGTTRGAGSFTALAANGGLTVSASGAAITGNSSITGTLTTTSTLTVSAGGLTVTAGTTALGALLDLSGAAAGQIKFTATQNASADANTLDDYEEGTWTPSLTFGGGSTGLTYLARDGSYVKIGKLVFLHFFIALNTKGSSTGNAQIQGIPFTSENTVNRTWATSGYAATLSGAGAPVFQLGANTTLMTLLYSYASGSTVMTHANFIDGAELACTLCYRATS